MNNVTGFMDLIRNSSDILDIGCGPNGAYWYGGVPEKTNLYALDLYYSPTFKKNNFFLYRIDALDLEGFQEKRTVIKIENGADRKEDVHWAGKFDFIIADHVFEHVREPRKLALGIATVLKRKGHVHISIPDPFNFTDRFYHLIHQDEGGGGHVSKITKNEMIAIMADNHFSLVDYKDIPDEWLWLKLLFDWKGRGIQYFDQDDLNYIADTFIKELTPDKGYFYGGEFLFRKN